MEKQETVRNSRSLTELLRRRRDPAGDLPFDPDAEPPMEDGEARWKRSPMPGKKTKRFYD